MIAPVSFEVLCVVSVNVFAPAKLCALVFTKPRWDALASTTSWVALSEGIEASSE